MLLLAAAVLLVQTAAAERPPVSLTPWVAADFDGDSASDFVRGGSFRSDGRGFIQEINLHLSTAGAGTISVHTAAIACRLVARDVDGDSDRDLILETLFREPLAILLNDGGGRFHEAPIEDFGYLFSRRERCSWEAAGRLAPDTFARDAYQDDVFVALPMALFAQLTSGRSVESRDGVGASAIVHTCPTRGPPAA